MGAEAVKAGTKGRMGEDFAAEVLEKQGYKILGRNVHSARGEVDLIAQKDQVLAFVEVKTRKHATFYPGSLAVTPEKQRRIIQTALLWLQGREDHGEQLRFDVFLVETDGRGQVLQYEHMEGAFDGEAYRATGH